MIPRNKLGFREGNFNSNVEIELFLDLNCPYSRKIYQTFNSHLLSTYHQKLGFTIHLVIQPWHSQGTWQVHESVYAVHQVDPKKTLEWITAFYSEHYDDFRTKKVFDKTRLDVYEYLAAIVEKDVGISKEKFLQKLIVGFPNAIDWSKDSDVIPALKYATKYHRKRGVHVTPTVFVNGIEATEVSSGWTPEQWDKFLVPLL